jgi:hypothetical protein
MSDIRLRIARIRNDVVIETWPIACPPAPRRYPSVVVNHVIGASSSTPPMGRHPKSKKSTLTKIDPAILRPKPQTISQHASHTGVPVTTPVNPVRDPPLEEPATFNADPSNFKGEYSEDGFSEEEVVRDYYITRVRCFFSPPARVKLGNLSLPGQPTTALDGGTTTFPRRPHSFGGPGNHYPERLLRTLPSTRPLSLSRLCLRSVPMRRVSQSGAFLQPLPRHSGKSAFTCFGVVLIH